MIHFKEESNPKAFLIIAKINDIEVIYSNETREKRKDFLDRLHEICGKTMIKFEYSLEETAN